MIFSESNGYDIEQIEVGMTTSISRNVTEADVNTFATISGDSNPVHLSDAYAAQSQFRKRIAHGLLSSSFFSALFGTRIPGPGCVYVSQSLYFQRPVYIGDTVDVKVSVTRINKEKRRVFFDTLCSVSGRKVITGHAEIYIPVKTKSDFVR